MDGDFGGLFPKISKLMTSPPQDDIQLDDLDDACTISSSEIHQKIKSMDHADWTNKNNIKFFYSKIFGKVIEDENLSDFANYDRMIKQEDILEAKAKKAIAEIQSHSIEVNVDLEKRFYAGKDPEKKIPYPVWKGKLRSSRVHHDNSDYYDLNNDSNSLTNRTEIIDLTKIDVEGSTNSRGDWDFGEQKQQKYHLQRKLDKQQIQMVALGGTLGVGLFLNSGKAFSIGGPLGCFLGFLISGSIVLATMLSFAEMSTLIPTTSSISGLASRFVEDAFGFALGWCYWLSFSTAMPSEVCAGTIMLSYYPKLNVPSPSTAGFVTLFLSAIISINLFDVRVYGNVEYLFSFFKVLIVIALIITMIVINVKEHYGFKYWSPSQSGSWQKFGPFRPTFDLNDVGTGSKDGIGGDLGRLLGTLSSVLISSYAYTGSEIGFVASMECKNPRKALPSVTKRVFGRVIVLYLLSIFLVGLNMYSGDLRLLRYYTPIHERKTVPIEYYNYIQNSCSTFSPNGSPNGNQSPWIIALQSAGYCTFSSVLNVIFVVFAVSAGSSHLYVSSRTLYSMATQGKAFSIFAKCSKAGVPYVSVLFSGSIGLLSYLSVQGSAMIVFQAFATVSSGTAMLMWSGMCLSFLRFYYGLKLRPDIISRNDPSYPYRSPLQPFLAIYGLMGSFMIVLLMGFEVFLKGYWDVKTFFTAYGSLIMFVICYTGFKLFRSSRIHRLDQLDLDSGRREMDRIIWDEDKYYISSMKEIFRKVIGWLA